LDNNNTNNSFDSKEATIQKLLEEIQFPKNRINQLEQKQDNAIHLTVLESSDDDSLYFVNWISDYIQGMGHYGSKVKDVKSIL